MQVHTWQSPAGLLACSPDGTATGLYVRIWSGALRPLRSITPAEVRAEGFRKRRDLQRAWDRMYYNRPDLQWSANPIVAAFHVEPACLGYEPGNCPTWVIPFDETPGVWDLDAVRLFHFMGADEVDDLFGILSEASCAGAACHDSNLNGELS